MKARVAIYVFAPRNPPKKTRRDTGTNVLLRPAYCHDGLLFVGLEMLRIELEKAGVGVAYAGADSIHKYDVALVSITGAMEWYRFLREKSTWGSGHHPVVIVGGAALTNVQPFLPEVDCVVWGRAEDIIVQLVESALSGQRMQSEGICWSSDWDAGQVYRFRQAPGLCHYAIKVGGETTKRHVWKESALGCKNKCLFCLYSWTHRQIRNETAGQFNTRRPESTFLEIDPAAPPLVAAVDGMSERLRTAACKRISRDAMLAKLVLIGQGPAKPRRLKLFNIIGYPTESDADWKEFVDVFAKADSLSGRKRSQWGIDLHCTRLYPEPCTPLATLPVSVERYCGGETAKRLRRLGGCKLLAGDKWFNGGAFWAFQSHGTESVATSALRLLTMRGEKSDAGIIKRIAQSKRFWQASSDDKMATLVKEADVLRLFRRYGWDELPTVNLEGIAPRGVLEKAEAKFWKMLDAGKDTDPID